MRNRLPGTATLHAPPRAGHGDRSVCVLGWSGKSGLARWWEGSDLSVHPNTHTDLKPHLTSRSAQRAHALQAWRRPTGPPLLGPVCLYPFCKTPPPHPPPLVSLTHPPVWAGSPPAPSLRAALSLPPPSGPSHSTRLEGF